MFDVGDGDFCEAGLSVWNGDGCDYGDDAFV